MTLSSARFRYHPCQGVPGPFDQSISICSVAFENWVFGSREPLSPCYDSEGDLCLVFPGREYDCRSSLSYLLLEGCNPTCLPDLSYKLPRQYSQSGLQVLHLHYFRWSTVC